MNYHVMPLSKWGQCLYRAGLKSRHISSHGDVKDLRALRTACENAERLLRMQEENRRLFDIVTKEPLSAQEWGQLHRLKKRMYPVLRRFVADADLYEWPALVTACIPTAGLPEAAPAGISAVPTAEDLLTEDGNGS